MNLAELIEIVLKSRRKTAGVFPLPDVDSCIDYAITEAGEYLDALLRERRRRDLRNNEKDHDARREWGQCGYMICSAFIQLPPMALEGSWTYDCTVYSVLTWLCLYQDAEDDTALTDALQAWVNLCDREGWDAADLLHETCQAFEAKHGPKKIPYPVLSAEEAEA
jgi:hypothetical protein